MYRWHHRTKQGLSCKFCHTFWLLNQYFDTIFHWLHFLNILWILDIYSAFFYILYHLIVTFSLIFQLFFFFLLITTIIITPSLLMFFFGFHWFYTFEMFFFVFLISFWTVFLWFSCSFLLTNTFSLVFLFLVAFTFFLQISGCTYALWLLFCFCNVNWS